MQTSDGSPYEEPLPAAPVPRGRHLARLAVLLVGLTALFLTFAVFRPVDLEQVRAAVAAAGPFAPVAYVVASAALGALLVPGPLLAAGSGVLFGPLLGTAVTLGATVGTAVTAALLGRRAGRGTARGLLGEARAEALDARLQRWGVLAVVGQRFVPGISDAMASYTFGALGVALWQMAAGALIGSLPRAFVYTALGASLGNLDSPLVWVAVAVWCVTAAIGAAAAHRLWRRRRAD